MKHILSILSIACIITVYLISPAMADGPKVRVIGEITSINQGERSFILKGKNGQTYTFVTDRHSDFEIEYRSEFYDEESDTVFQELKVGDKVKVKAYKGTPLVVDDVTIFR